jgi:predicted sulfurtransferase
MTSLNESIAEIKTHIFVAESELNDLIAGKKASASRVRKSLQQIKKLSHLLRKAIVEFTKTLPVKKRALSPKTEEPKTEEPKVEEPKVESKPVAAVKRKRLVKRDPSL